jgi:hypothetical protein
MVIQPVCPGVGPPSGAMANFSFSLNFVVVVVVVAGLPFCGALSDEQMCL